MPIDFLERRKTAEQGLTDLVSGRNVDDELSQMQKNVQDLRGRFLEKSSALIQSKGGGNVGAIAPSAELDDRTKAILARKRRDLQTRKMQSIFNNAYNLAVQAGMDEQSAVDYARQVSAQQSEEEYTASESEKGREHKRKLAKLAEQFGIEQEGLYDEFSGDSDLLPTLLGSVLGTGTNVLLDRYFRNQRLSQKSSSVPNVSGRGNTGDLRRRSGFALPYSRKPYSNYQPINYRVNPEEEPNF